MDLDFVEYFAGDRAVTSAQRQAGWRAASFEMKHDAVGQNMLTNTGFMHALLLICLLRIGGACLSAPVCSSWVWISQGTMGRSRCEPLGRWVFVQTVAEANVMVSRVLLLQLVAHAKGAVPMQRSKLVR
jgi:hypothetical protein